MTPSLISKDIHSDIHTHTHTHTHAYAYTHLCTLTHTYTHTLIHSHTNTCTLYSLMHVFTCAHLLYLVIDVFVALTPIPAHVNELLIRNESESQGGSLTDKVEELLRGI